MNHTRATTVSSSSVCIRRLSWEEKEKKIRPAHEGDQEYIPDTNLEGVYVEDCPKERDCQIRIYNFTDDDKNAEDWEVANCNIK